MVERIVVAITGATGAIYGYRLLRALQQMEKVEIHLVISEQAEHILKNELSLSVDDLKKLSHRFYDESDFYSPISSGSFITSGMVIAPCSMRTLSSIANGYEDNVIVRAASVTLKERRRLILLTRETPLNLIHIRNMESVTLAGGIVMPPLPPLYFGKKTMDELVDLTVGRILSLLGLRSDLLKQWGDNDLQ